MAPNAIRFEGDASLDPRDNLFGRVILRNKLATKEELEQCVKELLAERSEFGSKRTLPDLLIEKGHLDEKGAGKIRRAIDQKLAERSTERAERAPPGASGVIEAAGGGKSVEERKRLREEREAEWERRLSRFVKLAIHSRIHQEVLLHIVSRRIGVPSPNGIASSLGKSPAEIMRVLADWRRAEIVRPRGAYPYAYEPSERERQDIEIFCRLWRQPKWHTKLLGMILAQEGR